MGILYFYYLIWLKEITNLSNFQQKICGNSDYLAQLIYFLYYIIIVSLLVPSSDLFSI